MPDTAARRLPAAPRPHRLAAIGIFFAAMAKLAVVGLLAVLLIISGQFDLGVAGLAATLAVWSGIEIRVGQWSWRNGITASVRVVAIGGLVVMIVIWVALLLTSGPLNDALPLLGCYLLATAGVGFRSQREGGA